MKDENKTKAELLKEMEITKLKQTEQAIQESENRFRELFNHMSSGVAIYEAKDNGRDFIIKDFNRAAEKIDKIKKEDVIGKSVLKVFPGVKDFGLFKIFQEVYRTGKTQYFPISQYQDQRITGWRESYVYKITSGEIVSVYDDITQRKQAEERIKHLNLVLRAIRNVNTLIVKEKNRKRLLKGACDNLIKTRGYYSSWIVLLDEEGKLITYADTGLGKDFLPIIELLKKGKMPVCIQNALKKKRIIITENPLSYCTECPLSQKYGNRGIMTIRLEHGKKVYGIMSVSIPVNFIDDKEEHVLFEEIAGDIALGLHGIKLNEERKQAEEKYRKLIKTTSEGFWLLNYKKLTIEVNQSLCDMLGYTRNEMIGKTPMEFVDAENKKIFKEQTSQIKNTTHRTYEISLKKKDGINFPTIFNATTLVDKKGETEGSFAFVTDITELKQSQEKLKKTMDATIDTMSNMIEAKDPYTSGHQHRVCQLTVPLARELGLPEDKIEGIRITSLIHDIGKIGLPTEILSKPIKLTDIEFSLIKDHSRIGHDILQSIDFSYPVAKIVLQHHEKLNGSGYPGGLKGDEILLEAKIICVADVVEAMSSHRPYRPALGIDVALEEISQNKGILYDPEVVDACIKLFKEKGFKFE